MVEDEVPEVTGEDVPTGEAVPTAEAPTDPINPIRLEDSQARPEARGTPPTHHRAVVIATIVMGLKLGTVWHP